MNNDWLKNPHRTETFVLNFQDEVAWAVFWNTYVQKGLECGVYASTMARGDKMKVLDNCQNCLYEALDKIEHGHVCSDEWAEKAGKLAES